MILKTHLIQGSMAGILFASLYPLI